MGLAQFSSMGLCPGRILASWAAWPRWWGLTLSYRLPGCSEQDARKRCPELGARLAFGRVGSKALSDKELRAMLPKTLDVRGPGAVRQCCSMPWSNLFRS